MVQLSMLPLTGVYSTQVPTTTVSAMALARSSVPQAGAVPAVPLPASSTVKLICTVRVPTSSSLPPR